MDTDRLPTVGKYVRAGERLVIYGINYAPELTGVGLYSGELGAYLAAQGYEVTVVTATPHYPGWEVSPGYRNRYQIQCLDGVRVLRCPILLTRKMRGITRLLAPLSFAITSSVIAIWQIVKLRPRTVLCIEPTLFAAPVALATAKLMGARTVLHVQDLEVDAAFAVGHLRGGIFKRIAFRMEKALLSAFDCVVTISNAMSKKLEDKGVPPERLRLIRNWVDLAKIRAMPGPNGFRRELGLADDVRVIQYSGNIGAKQALHLVLDAAEQLVARKDIVFVIAGEGPEKPKLISRYGQLPNVRFLGLQPAERFCEFLNLADLHVVPQDANAADLVLPSKLAGMLASGKPILVMANLNTEMEEFLRGVALIVKPGDVEALATQIVSQCSSTCFDNDKAKALAAELDCRKALSAFQDVLLARAASAATSASHHFVDLRR